MHNSSSISIHAPSRERRASALSANYNLGISIHAPSRERPVWYDIYKLNKAISIHAPSRERRKGCQSSSWYSYFNPRSLAGATTGFAQRYSAIIFQSTLPRGSDGSLTVKGNSTIIISIHAPSRERLLLLSRQIITLVFQSTLPRGSDRNISTKSTTS